MIPHVVVFLAVFLVSFLLFARAVPHASAHRPFYRRTPTRTPTSLGSRSAQTTTLLYCTLRQYNFCCCICNHSPVTLGGLLSSTPVKEAAPKACTSMLCRCAVCCLFVLVLTVCRLGRPTSQISRSSLPLGFEFCGVIISSELITTMQSDCLDLPGPSTRRNPNGSHAMQG